MSPRVVIIGMISLLGSTAGTKAIHLALIAVATRKVGLAAVGMVFFVEAAAAIGLRVLDLGFYEVLVRRTARSETSRHTLGRAMAFRSGVLVVACGIAAGITKLVGVANPLVVTGFFAAFGIFFLHETGRAVLAGKEMFARNAAVALGSRGIGTAIAIGGMASGYGLEAWLAGMLLAESLQLAGVTALAMRALPRKAPDGERPLLREGAPFWALALLKQTVAQGSSLIVGGWLGFADNGIFGVANKVIQGALLAVVSLTYAAYPALARDRRRVIERMHVIVVLVASGMVAGLVALGAPALAPLLGSVDAARTVEVTRWLTLAAFLIALAQAFDTWLRAKDSERSLVGVAFVEGVVMLGSMAALIPLTGLVGAVIGVTAGAATRLVGVAYVARATIRSESPRQPERVI